MTARLPTLPWLLRQRSAGAVWARVRVMVPMSVGVLALAACGAQRDEAVMSGYAEAEII